MLKSSFIYQGVFHHHDDFDTCAQCARLPTCDVNGPLYDTRNSAHRFTNPIRGCTGNSDLTSESSSGGRVEES